MAACVYGSASCAGRSWGANGSREHTSCAKGRAALAALYERRDYAQEIARRQAAGRAKFEAARKVAEPVKPVVDVDVLAKAIAVALAQVLGK